MSSQIGERIREARQARGISLRQLASKVGIHFSHLSKIENGKDTVGKDSLIRIAEELNADPDFMLGEAGHQSMPFRILGNIAAGVPRRVPGAQNVGRSDPSARTDTIGVVERSLACDLDSRG